MGDSENAKSHYDLGRAYKDQGKLDEAIREYQEAIRIEPDYACAHCRLGAAYGSKGESDLEISEYKKALSPIFRFVCGSHPCREKRLSISGKQYYHESRCERQIDNVIF